MNTGKMLFIIFLILKLTGNIDWSWFFVLLPAIIEIGLMTLGHVRRARIRRERMKRMQNTP